MYVAACALMVEGWQSRTVRLGLAGTALVTLHAKG
jgi:hypothetical protein